ncbi:MAG: DUF58 domain-containing protein [Thermoplasmata archaeon]
MSTGGNAPAPFHWRGRSYVLFGAGVALLATGIAVRNPAPLLLALPVLLAPFAAALLGPRRALPAELDWRVEGEREEVRVSGAIAFQPPADPSDIVVEFPQPAGVTESDPPHVEREGRELRFVLNWNVAEPSVLPVPVPRLVWRDPADLVERAVVWDPPDLVIERYPPELLRIGTVRLERTIAVPGETLSRRIGSNGEFFGIRDATPTEPPRRINWLASARAGRLLANEFRVERTGDVLLLIDARPSSLGPRVDTQLLSISVAAAHGIAESFLREKARVGLGIYGEFLATVPLASGRTQRVRLRNTLLRTRLASVAGPAERCAIALRRYFPSGVTTILLTNLTDDASAHLVPHLRRRGFPVVVLSPSPLPMLARPPTLSAEEAVLVLRIARLIRRGRLAETWRDAPVVDWEDYWSLGGLVELLRRPNRRGRAW